VAAEEAIQVVPLVTGVSGDHGPRVMFVSSFVRGLHTSAGTLTDPPALNCILFTISTADPYSTAGIGFLDINKGKGETHTAGPPHRRRSTTSDL